MTTTEAIALAAVIVTALGLLLTIATVLVSRAANAINRASAAQQIAAAERELFLSLVATRTKWMSDYLEAFIKRQNEWRHDAHLLIEGKQIILSGWEKRLVDLGMEAGWLFDDQITEDQTAIFKAQSRAHGDYISWLRAGNAPLPDEEVGPDRIGMTDAHEALGRMVEHMNRYLYVGDIQRQQAGSK